MIKEDTKVGETETSIYPWFYPTVYYSDPQEMITINYESKAMYIYSKGTWSIVEATKKDE